MAKPNRRKPTYQEEEEILNDIVNSHSFTPNQPILKNAKIDVEPKSENQKRLLELIKTREIVICSGPAGTGKTYLACVQALNLFKSDFKYRKIILVKSVTTLKDEEIGYLKGTLEEKMEPFVYSFFSNFEKILPKNVIKNLKDSGSIEVLPIAYMRGINLDNCVVIIDECQNISPDNMRTIMTRIGKDCKMIFLGDEGQIDLKNKKNSSLQLIMEKFSSVPEFGCIRFTEEDTVRNPLIRKVEEVFRSISGATA
jgi:phosphate starvation-inducible PhoH-like protein